MEFAPKKKDNYNIVAMWPHYMILLIVTSNDIPLSPSIALAYYLVPDGSFFGTLNLIHLLLEIGILYCIIEKLISRYLICWKAYQQLSYFVGKRFFHHPTAVLISTHQHPICWDATFFDSIPLRFGSPLIALQLRLDDTFIDPFPSLVSSLRFGKKAFLIHTKL